MTWVAVGVTAVGAVGSVVAGGSASRAQQKAADQASAIQRDQYQQTRQDNMPALEARNNALASMQDLAERYGSNVPSAQAVMEQPGYMFGLKQGQDAIQNSAAAAGGLYSGAVGKALAKYGTDYATSKYNDAFNQMQSAQTNAFNRYASISGQGQTGANQIGSAGQGMANQLGQIGMSNANAQGAATIAQGNAIQNGLNQGVSWWNNRSQTPSTSYTAPNANGSYNNPTGDGYNWFSGNDVSPVDRHADGGPIVRHEPKVGSRSPLPSGTSGGLSANAIAQILAAKPEEHDDSLARLPANPVTKPKAIIAQRLRDAGEYAHGGHVSGPGGPRDDAIPAMLSNGEHVMDTASVTALGGGSNAAGQAKLNKLRAMLKKAH